MSCQRSKLKYEITFLKAGCIVLHLIEDLVKHMKGEKENESGGKTNISDKISAQ